MIILIAHHVLVLQLHCALFLLSTSEISSCSYCGFFSVFAFFLTCILISFLDLSLLSPISCPFKAQPANCLAIPSVDSQSHQLHVLSSSSNNLRIYPILNNGRENHPISLISVCRKNGWEARRDLTPATKECGYMHTETHTCTEREIKREQKETRQQGEDAQEEWRKMKTFIVNS